VTSTLDLYGTGLSFPPRVGPDGSMVWATGEIDVRECICTILRTRTGERVERPTFGCGLSDYLFAPNSDATLRLIQEEVTRALQTWEPRITLNNVSATLHPTDARAVDVVICYTLIATSQRERLAMTVSLDP
jgi:phage baseplate assembly protein W